MAEDEGDTTRLLRLLVPYAGSHTEEGDVIVRTEGDQLVLRTDKGDRPLVTLERSELPDLLCQLRGHSDW